MNILFIWTNADNDTVAYEFNNLDSAISERLLECHHRSFDSSEGDKLLVWLLNFLNENDDCLIIGETDPPAVRNGMWAVIVLARAL